MKKIAGFVPRSKDALHNFIKKEQTQTSLRIGLLTTGDKNSLEQQRRKKEQQIHEIEARVSRSISERLQRRWSAQKSISCMSCGRTVESTIRLPQEQEQNL